jgi:hypothetical protein
MQAGIQRAKKESGDADAIGAARRSLASDVQVIQETRTE